MEKKITANFAQANNKITSFSTQGASNVAELKNNIDEIQDTQTLQESQSTNLLESIKSLFNTFFIALEKLLSGSNAETLNILEEVQNEESAKEQKNEEISNEEERAKTETEKKKTTRELLNDHGRFMGIMIGQNYKAATIDEQVIVDDSNKGDILEYYEITDETARAEFDAYFAKYECVSLVTDQGVEVLRFNDSWGKPVLEYSYGYENDGGNGSRMRTVFTYNSDGSYSTSQTKQCKYNGITMDLGLSIPIRHYTKDDVLKK